MIKLGLKINHWIIILFAAFSFSLTACHKEATKPNVILIMVDDQGYGDIAAHGNPWIKTPNIDKLHDVSTPLTQKVQDIEMTKEIDQNAEFVEYTVELKKGETHLQTWFTLDNEVEIGAYYAEIEKI